MRRKLGEIEKCRAPERREGARSAMAPERREGVCCEREENSKKKLKMESIGVDGGMCFLMCREEGGDSSVCNS
jgi:hypothetical protein